MIMVSATNSSHLSERSLYLFKVLVEHFIEEIAEVRDDIERMEARVQRLLQARK